MLKGFSFGLTTTVPGAHTWTGLQTFSNGSPGASGTGALQWNVPPIVAGTGIGTFNFGHHSFANSFGETRDNDVYCLGYNISEAGIPLDTGDDALTDIWETNYAQTSPQRMFERHVGAVRKKGGGEVRPLTLQIEKWNSATPYATLVGCQTDSFTVTDKTAANNTFIVNTTDATTGHGHTYAVGDFEARGKTADRIFIINQQGSGNTGEMAWQISDATKWRFQARPTGQSFDFWILSETLSTSPIVLQLGQADAKATFGGKIQTAASTTSRAGLNVPSGTAPSSPVNGDIWSDGTNVLVRLAGTTRTITVT